MKKILYLLALLPMTILFTACPEPDSVKEEPIVGIWKMKTLETYEVDEKGNRGYDFEDYEKSTVVWHFNDDNTLDMFEEGYNEGTYKYKVKGNKLYSEFIEEWYEGSVSYATIDKLTDNELVIAIEFYTEGGYLKETFSFKKIK